MSTYPILIIHGGAGKKTKRNRDKVNESLQIILEKSFAVLERGGSAMLAVEHAVKMLEDNPLFNAGKGSKIQSDGKIRMSAGIMDGAKLNFSGCINVQGVKNPIELAKLLQSHESKVLSESGAQKFARAKKLEFASPYTPEQIADWKLKNKKNKFGTVGAVAIDKRGNLAAATSTGGRGFEYPHRVSDTPTVAGNYANSACAVSTTGAGEQIVNHAAAATVCNLVDNGIPLDRAINYVIKMARKKKSDFAFIALDKKGNVRSAMTSEHLTWGYRFGKEIFTNP